jgi:hypothetical protein
MRIVQIQNRAFFKCGLLQRLAALGGLWARERGEGMKRKERKRQEGRKEERGKGEGPN